MTTTKTTNQVAAYRIIFKNKKIFEIVKELSTKHHISIRQFIEDACLDAIRKDSIKRKVIE